MPKFLTSTPFLYIACVVIWGSTWFTIEFQLGYVAHEYSSFYRFALASLFLFVYCFYKKLPLNFAKSYHLWLIAMGSTLFCLNYLMVYEAQEYLTSAMASVIFSVALIANIINSRIFFKTPITLNVVVGALLGLTGIVLIFWDDIRHFNFESDTFYALGIALIGVLAASFGNMISVHTQKYHIPVIQMNAWAMAYGALISLLVGLVQGKPMTYDTSWSYSITLLYLALFGSVLAFGAYLTLMRRIGVQKTSYTIVLFPAVALIISTFFENFVWTPMIALGIVLIALGNVIVIRKKKAS